MGLEFSLLYLTKVFLILRTIQRWFIIIAHRSVLMESIVCFNESWIFSRDLKKSKFHENPSIESRDVSWWRTNMHACTRAHTHKPTHARTQTDTHARRHTHMRTHTHTHTHKHTLSALFCIMSHRQQDVEQVTSTQIYTTVTKQNTTNKSSLH